MSGEGPTVISAVVKPIIGAAVALGIFLLGSVLLLVFIVCIGTIATFVAAPGVAGLASAFILGLIAVIIFGVELVVGFVLTLFVGLPLGALSAVFLRRSTPLAAQLAIYFVVGVLSAAVLIVVFSLGSETGSNGAQAALDDLVSPIGLILALVTGMCAAAGWTASTAIFSRREASVGRIVMHAQTVGSL